MKKVFSSLGENTAPKQYTSMIAYTVNISNHQWIVPYSCVWEECSPDKQYRFLKYIHREIYNKLTGYLEIDNKVAFEFTKKGELHSHGYFTFKDCYSGFGKYPIIIQKYILNKICTKNRHAAFVRWVEDKRIWLDYIEKESASSGYNYYVTTGEQTITLKKTVDWYLSNEPKLPTEEKMLELAKADAKATIL